MAGAYKRVLLKLSGEALMGDLPYGIDPTVATSIALQIKDAQHRLKQSNGDAPSSVEVAIVIGGGNIWRRLAASSTDVLSPIIFT